MTLSLRQSWRSIGFGETYTSPKKGQDKVPEGVSVVYWHAAAVAHVTWEPL